MMFLRFSFSFFFLVWFVNGQICMNGLGNYTANSTYQRNLNNLITSLISNTEINYGFYNLSVGQTADRVNTIAFCRGDIPFDMCQNCIRDASDETLRACPNQKEAITFPDYCMFRYSNRSIFGVMDTSATVSHWSPEYASDENRYKLALDTLLSRLRSKAAAGNSTRKFAAGIQSAGNETIFGLAECTPDLSEHDCQNCFSSAVREIGICCNGRFGGRVSLPSCNIRYENYRFLHFKLDDASLLSSEPPISPNPLSKGTRRRMIIIIVVCIVSVVMTLLLCIIINVRFRRLSKSVENGMVSPEALQFDFETVRVSTDNFSDINKLGEGGFGSVYKGRLVDGQCIAVKRLSSHSKQGDLEFKNELMLVAKLQHRNLVKLLGFCFEGDERLLIYEFVPNGSLDQFIFDPVRCKQLNWENRYKIICGIAKGLLYLHEDSRLRIIHRDLKASNILLDAEMNPKISDFGLARLLIRDQTHNITNRIFGTFGYMAPEYVKHGQISSKSDVFSFGVLILEIVSGKRSSFFSNEEKMEDLLSYAWKNWKAGTVLDVIYPNLKSSSTAEMARCVHIGLLCVQDNIAERPSMASIVLMLNSHSSSLPLPSQPSNCSDSNMLFLLGNSTETGQATEKQCNSVIMEK